ncbi:MAG: PEP-CTERM sorting domain-containing protein, partial [Planctomycetales bacterium]|nr:PEP-CTERM sorting domain-containing protein [Planctomycetales bacterium]
GLNPITSAGDPITGRISTIGARSSYVVDYHLRSRDEGRIASSTLVDDFERFGFGIDASFYTPDGRYFVASYSNSLAEVDPLTFQPMGETLVFDRESFPVSTFIESFDVDPVSGHLFGLSGDNLTELTFPELEFVSTTRMVEIFEQLRDVPRVTSPYPRHFTFSQDGSQLYFSLGEDEPAIIVVVDRVVPEPHSLLLLVLGVLSATRLRRNRPIGG